MEDLAANFAKNGDISQLQHGLDKVHEADRHSQQKRQVEGKRDNDNPINDHINSANYSSMDMGNIIRNSYAHMSGGCKQCGKNVIHLDGRCEVYKASGIRDTNYDSQANYAMDTRGKQHRVLFDGVQDCAQLFHLPLRLPDAMFDGLDDDDDDVPVNVGTSVPAAGPATAPE